MWWPGRGNSGGSWLPEERKANMWHWRGISGASWPPAFPRSCIMTIHRNIHNSFPFFLKILKIFPRLYWYSALSFSFSLLCTINLSILSFTFLLFCFVKDDIETILLNLLSLFSFALHYFLPSYSVSFKTYIFNIHNSIRLTLKTVI